MGISVNSYNKQIAVIAAVSFLTLSACGDSVDDGPSNKQVQGKLTFSLPDYIQVNSLDVHASENFGSEVEPLIRARFTADAKLSEPLYIKVADTMQGDVIRVQSEVGTPIKVTGRYSATMQGDAWKISFENIETAPKPRGYKLSNWSVGNYVLAGSEEEKALIAAQKERAAKQEEQRLARIKAEEERKRIEAIEREKTAKLEAKLATERAEREKQEAEKRAAEQRSQMAALAQKEKQQAEQEEAQLAAFRQEITGQWEAITPVIARDKTVYYSSSRAKKNCSGEIKFSFSIPAGEFETVATQIRVFMPSRPQISKTSDASILIGKNRSLAISFAAYELKCPYTSGSQGQYSHTVAVYEALGEPWKGEVKNGELVLKGGRDRTITMRKIGG